MKLARPIIIGSFAFVLTFAVLSLVYIATAQFLTSPIAASANPTYAAYQITRAAASNTGHPTAIVTDAPAPTDVPAPTATSTATPTGIPPVAPPTPPPASSAAFRQGMMLRTNADYANAAVSFRAVLSENPEPGLAREAQFRLGENLWLAGKLDEAAAELNKLIAANGTDGLAMRGHYFLAQVLIAQKNYSAAVEHLRAYRAQTRALAGEMDAEIADTLLAMGDDGGAMKQYGVALADPTLTNAQRVQFLIKLSRAYTALGSTGEAVARLEQAFAIAPDDENAAEAEYRWGVALDAMGQHAKAVAHWRHAVEAYPAEDDGYNALVALVDAGEPVDDYLRGVIDYNADAYDAASAALSRYVNANPGNNAAALYYLGRSYMG
ncbi:MAG: tetratricopeptide repeat protein, partial [Rudaea sp.]